MDENRTMVEHALRVGLCCHDLNMKMKHVNWRGKQIRKALKLTIEACTGTDACRTDPALEWMPGIEGTV